MSIHTEYLQEAYKLNNTGVACLFSNDAGAAVKAFKSALSIMERVSNDDASEDLILPDADHVDGCSWVEIPGLEDAAFFIYNRAILFGPSSSSHQDMDLVFSNAAILFNLALAFHLHGQLCRREPLLRRAAFMYGHVIKLVAYLANNANSDRSSATALAVTAMNNQAQILHSDLVCEYARARMVLEQVRALSDQVQLLLPDDPAAHHTSAALFDRSQFDEIYLNVALAQAPTAAPSA